MTRTSEDFERHIKLLSWDDGQSSPGWWWRVIELQLGRIEDAQGRLATHGTALSGDDWDQLRADAHFLLVAIRHLLRYGDHFRELFPRDRRLGEARDAFAARVPNVKTVRDFLEHLDEYAVGEGRLQRAGRIDSHVREAFAYTSPGSLTAEVWLIVGDMNLPVKEAARAGLEFADVLDKVLDEARMSIFDGLFGRISEE